MILLIDTHFILYDDNIDVKIVNSPQSLIKHLYLL